MKGEAIYICSLKYMHTYIHIHTHVCTHMYIWIQRWRAKPNFLTEGFDALLSSLELKPSLRYS